MDRDIPPANAVRQRLRHVPQHIGRKRSTIRFADRFVPVDLNAQQRNVAAGLYTFRHHALQLNLKICGVCQSGERVGIFVMSLPVAAFIQLAVRQIQPRLQAAFAQGGREQIANQPQRFLGKRRVRRYIGQLQRNRPHRRSAGDQRDEQQSLNTRGAQCAADAIMGVARFQREVRIQALRGAAAFRQQSFDERGDAQQTGRIRPPTTQVSGDGNLLAIVHENDAGTRVHHLAQSGEHHLQQRSFVADGQRRPCNGVGRKHQ
ncbi:MAG: hypothetical protein BWY76_02278 [bacterium ADurb.Bin429]|nr:MAG: hypothetical protein BWY76_02278 [bacterium ADurb.Bin429]